MINTVQYLQEREIRKQINWTQVF